MEAIVRRAAEALQISGHAAPRTGMILGSGLGPLAEELEAPVRIPYEELDGLPATTAVGHAGEFLLGALDGHDLIAMNGRFHCYEGHGWEQITLPIRIMHALGIELLIVSNASGGLSPRFCSGDVLLIESQLNLMHLWPGQPAPDPRNPRCAAPTRPDYDRSLIELCQATARAHGFNAQPGVYIGLSGPNYETRAEYRFLRRIGGDAVGMSTIPETTVACSLGLRVLGLSVITNVANPDAPRETSAQEVIDLAATASTKLARLVRAVLAAKSPEPPESPSPSR